MAIVFGQIASSLSFFCREKSCHVFPGCQGVAREKGDSRSQDETEKMIRTRAKNGIGLSFGERQCACDLCYPPDVVTLVRVQRRKHFIRADCHWRKEHDAVVF